MVKFTQRVKNKVKVTGVVQGNGSDLGDGWKMYPVCVHRPCFYKTEHILSFRESVEDVYRVVAKNDDLKRGDIVEVKGSLCDMSNMFDRKEFICPVCGSNQYGESPKFTVIRTRKLRVIRNGDYYENRSVLESEAVRGKWHNSIVVLDMRVEDVVLYRTNSEIGIGDITYYEKEDGSLSYKTLHKGLDEFLGDRYKYDEKHRIYTNPSSRRRSGVIHRATGNIILEGRDDFINCYNCHSWTVIENKEPVIVFDKQPVFEETESTKKSIEEAISGQPMLDSPSRPDLERAAKKEYVKAITEKNIKDYINGCLKNLTKHENPIPIAILRNADIPSKYLFKVAAGLADEMKRDEVIVFGGTESMSNIIAGVGYSRTGNKNRLRKIMNNEYAIKCEEPKEFTKFILTVIKPEDYEFYKEKAVEIMSEISNDDKMTG